MPRTVSDLDTLLEYFSGVMDRTHHAPNVNAIALALIGAVLWRKDADTPIEVRTYGGSTANMLWVTISGQRYALAYNHHGRIELRNRSGSDVVHSFTNSTPVTEVRTIFEAL